MTKPVSTPRPASQHAHQHVTLSDCGQVGEISLKFPGMVLICTQLNTGSISTGQSYSSWRFKFFTHFFFNSLIFFMFILFVCFLLTCRSYVHILDTKLLSAECIASNFSLLVASMFHLFMLFPWILMWQNLSFFSFMFILLGFCLRNYSLVHGHSMFSYESFINVYIIIKPLIHLELIFMYGVNKKFFLSSSRF